ncbi:hypothetical protein [Nostoc sp.]|uniref:hypothetical protein n=1 Tax=Nostoc sp. TaxID=1180 RepID=UPI003FA560EC
MTKLEKLELINNQLTGLPDSIGNLSGLKNSILLYGNPLKSLPESLFNLPLEIAW